MSQSKPLPTTPLEADHPICTFARGERCRDCTIEGQVHCEMGSLERLKFFYGQLLFILLVTNGAFVVAGIATGRWWPIPAYFLFWVFFQLVVELLIHCPRCPYYNERSDRLFCIPNLNLYKPKWFRLPYRPGPYTLLEQAVTIASYIFSIAFPLLYLAWSMYHGLYRALAPGLMETLLLPLLTIALAVLWARFFFSVRARMCSRCANISCFMNGLPSPVARAYLDKNPTIKEAWERSGRFPEDRP